MAKWSLIVGAGPSLKRSDLDLLRGKFENTIAINCAVFFAPWADTLFAADGNWWKAYGPKIKWFKGLRVSSKYRAPGLTLWRSNWPRNGGNSGHAGLQYRVDNGGRNIAIIGFDQQRTEGRAHCHADHKSIPEQSIQLSNVDGIAHWPKAMSKTASNLKDRGVRVVNLSRVTALDCFERMTPEAFVEKELCLLD